MNSENKGEKMEPSKGKEYMWEKHGKCREGSEVSPSRRGCWESWAGAEPLGQQIYAVLTDHLSDQQIFKENIVARSIVLRLFFSYIYTSAFQFYLYKLDCT